MQNAITVRHRVHHSKDWIRRKRSGHRASKLNAHRHTVPYLEQRKRKREIERERDHRLRNTQRKQKKKKKEREAKLLKIKEYISLCLS